MLLFLNRAGYGAKNTTQVELFRVWGIILRKNAPYLAMFLRQLFGCASQVELFKV